MQSIYQQHLGERFQDLHPKIQERFAINSQDGICAFGRGVMEEIWHGRWYTLPFLRIGTLRNIMFPEIGKSVAFTIENYAWRDSFGRETVSWIRSFHFPKRSRRFDATMIYSDERECIVDYLGNQQHLAVDIHMSVAENGGVAIKSGEQRFYFRRMGFRYPMFFSGVAEVCEWYDDDADCFRIKVSVGNPYWGPLFGYRGSFQVEYQSLDERQFPSHVFPLKEEIRE